MQGYNVASPSNENDQAQAQGYKVKESSFNFNDQANQAKSMSDWLDTPLPGAGAVPAHRPEFVSGKRIRTYGRERGGYAGAGLLGLQESRRKILAREVTHKV